MDLKTAILSVYYLADDSLELLISYCEQVKYPKGYILVDEGTIEHSLYILTEGIMRAYTKQGEEEVTFWIGEEGCIGCSMRSYVDMKAGYETIELLEDSVMYRIDISRLKKLYESNIEIANWGRKFIEKEILNTENRLISQQFLTAKERYDQLIETNPRLLQRIPLSIIASYLGITQVSLSRIRAQR